jgi:hypothetical protein
LREKRAHALKCENIARMANGPGPRPGMTAAQ